MIILGTMLFVKCYSPFDADACSVAQKCDIGNLTPQAIFPVAQEKVSDHD